MCMAFVRPSRAQLPILTAQGVWQTADGLALGTTYHIRYLTRKPDRCAADIDRLFRAFNRSLSLYDPDSELCRFNRSDSHTFESPFFYPVLKRATELYHLTAGAFDPTVFPLVEAYGFGPKGRLAVNLGRSGRVRPVTLLSIVGLSNIGFNGRSVWKIKKGVQLDFNAIAKGYAVDCIGALLETKGVKRYLIEVGGEIRCKGLSEQQQPWRVGIVNPLDNQGLHSVLPLTNQAMATSGNYLNQFEHQGKVFSHIIDPKSGLMPPAALLSATVLTGDCMTADALATAFMVMGLSESQAFLRDYHLNLDAYLLSLDAKGALQVHMTEALAARQSATFWRA